MLHGPRSLDQFSPYHAVGIKYNSEVERQAQKREMPRAQRKMDWKKELEALKAETSPKRTSGEAKRIDITVQVGYTDDVGTVLAAVKRVLRETDNLLHEPEPELSIGDMDPTNISIHVRPFCSKDDYWDAVTALVKNLKYRFFRDGISYRSVKSNA